MSYVRYSMQFKLKIVSEVVLNKNERGIQSKVAQKYNVSNYSVNNWVKKYGNKIELRAKKNIKSEVAQIAVNNIVKENELLRSILVKKEIEINQLRSKSIIQTDNIC